MRWGRRTAPRPAATAPDPAHECVRDMRDAERAADGWTDGGAERFDLPERLHGTAGRRRGGEIRLYGTAHGRQGGEVRLQGISDSCLWSRVVPFKVQDWKQAGRNEGAICGVTRRGPPQAAWDRQPARTRGGRGLERQPRRGPEALPVAEPRRDHFALHSREIPRRYRGTRTRTEARPRPPETGPPSDSSTRLRAISTSCPSGSVEFQRSQWLRLKKVFR